MSSLFGHKPDKPVIKKVTPIQRVTQSEDEKYKIYKELAKRRRATLINQITSEANISRKRLGAA